ncbi:MAG: UDP-N-acetylglucosamine 2-epimerase [Methanocorpusculum sp.]|uniref:UDP-N-acetylglucosamine 2-epimerase n=1 Tax=Methanocorpusculum sp. TaxID=2058474 RepID=UPI0027226FCA|nr:UDP-N-acetylglucosamine 2-epimerase [Methanocorpusculum sp.]MDO9523805.1 UDP-N-acetylglucosamine 2-epimerase [Methanocorpusculum sp.]
MTKTICVVTATRAEWGLLRPLAELIKRDGEFNLLLAVTGTHFRSEFGNTYKEILADGFSIDERVDIILSPIQNAVDVSSTMARAISGFAEMFSRRTVNLLIVLGDRYETLAVSIAALNAKIPIAHLHGGELTEGAIDDSIRHAITKLSYLHFTSCEAYRRRVIQLGEQPNRVYNVGAIGIDNVRQMELLSKEDLASILNIDIKNSKYCVVTFHPETLNNKNVRDQCTQLLRALSAFPDLKYIITKSNADEGGMIINEMIDAYAKDHPNVLTVASLGNLKYLSALKHASAVIGNSSSGILEVPYFKIPTVNLGIRQKGRIMAETVINCSIETSEIVGAMKTAMSEDFLHRAASAAYPYGDGHAAERILAVLHEWLDNGRIDLKKEFYDIEVHE